LELLDKEFRHRSHCQFVDELSVDDDDDYDDDDDDGLLSAVVVVVLVVVALCEVRGNEQSVVEL